MEDLAYWVATNRKVALRVLELMKAAAREPFRELARIWNRPSWREPASIRKERSSGCPVRAQPTREHRLPTTSAKITC